jgi:hypothetical protein
MAGRLRVRDRKIGQPGRLRVRIGYGQNHRYLEVREEEQ